MIAVLPQTGQRHRNANGVTGAAQSQLVSGCFIGGTLSLWVQMAAVAYANYAALFSPSIS
jgi:hypothetical protein